MLQPPPPLPQETNPALRLTPLADLSGSLGQRVYLSLRRAILAVAYRPGEILRKPEICAALGVSRSPVSDAVARLAADETLHFAILNNALGRPLPAGALSFGA